MGMRIVAGLLFTSIFGCAAGAPPSTDPALETHIAGCYVLRSGAWESDSSLNRFYPVSQIPRRIQLDTARLTGYGYDRLQNDTLPMLAVRVPASTPASHVPFLYWRRMQVHSDSIYVGYPLSLGGADLRLVPAGEGLKGTLSTFTDVVPIEGGSSSSTAPIQLDRVACPMQ